MYSLTKRLATFAVILAVVLTLTGISLLIYAQSFMIELALLIAIGFYVVSSFLAFIALSCGLRSLCSDLDITYESTTREYLALKKRIEELEGKVKQ